MTTEVSQSNSTVLNGKLYFGGGVAKKEKEHNVYSYNIEEDHWSVLPALDVRNFSLGHIEGQLVSVGGAKKRPSRERTTEVFTFIESTGKWKKTYPSLLTARSSAVVFSLKHALIVACGYVKAKDHPTVASNSVEVFKPADSQWYSCKPSAWVPISTTINTSGVLIYPNIYMMGGIRIGVQHNEVVYAAVDDLLQSTIPADRVGEEMGTSKGESIWKKLPDTPTNKAAITTLNGAITALGGEEGARGDTNTSPIHMYSPAANVWINIGSLPSPRILTTVSALPPNEIVVIGGFDGTDQVNTVYKGTLQLQI